MCIGGSELSEFSVSAQSRNAPRTGLPNRVSALTPRTCSFTDSPDLADAILSHFPNAFIGITGVISYASNENTPEVVRRLGRICTPDSPAGLRILLETDAPFLAPSNLPSKQIGMTSKQRYPFCHGGVLPWTAEFIAGILNEGKGEDDRKWTTVDVLRQARENARACYRI